jgi:hypothetical protein
MKAIVDLPWGHTTFEVPFKDLELFLKIAKGSGVKHQWIDGVNRYYKVAPVDIRVDIIDTIHPRALSDDEVEAIKEAKRLAKEQQEAATT